METPHIQTAHKPGETPPNTYPDFDWVHKNRQKLLEQYGTCVILVYNESVVGTGATIDDALQNAEANIPADSNVITPIIYFLAPLHRIYRLP